ncbi:hypothetical protein J6590_041222 [Homalodisca vitripennis]|nr:hypothetical protein J6590_041222 [Homalodisca vitripennis]
MICHTGPRFKGRTADSDVSALFKYTCHFQLSTFIFVHRRSSAATMRNARQSISGERDAVRCGKTSYDEAISRLIIITLEVL